jgi:integrase
VSNSELKRHPLHFLGKRGRERGQNGSLRGVAKQLKRWRGHYLTYPRQEVGRERRKHKAVILGLGSKMTRKQAADALRAIIAEKSDLPVEKQSDMTFGQFCRERHLPLHQQKWKSSSRRTQIDNIELYCVKLLGEKLLKDLDRFSLQMRANLAQKCSKSVVAKFVICCLAILEEPLDQDLAAMNPAKKLMMPQTTPENKRFLELEQIAVVSGKLPVRGRLILRMSIILGLRPGELFALRWNDSDGYGNSLRLDETVDGKTFATLKTKNSCAFRALRAFLREGLGEWRTMQNPVSQEEFIFSITEGGMHRVDNYRADVLRPAVDASLREFLALRKATAQKISRRAFE